LEKRLAIGKNGKNEERRRGAGTGPSEIPLAGITRKGCGTRGTLILPHGD
jgi:hypothetical protein